MKVTVIGGGSTYTPELINGFLQRLASLPVDEVCLMDIDPDRLAVVGGFAQRMAAAHGAPFRVTLTGDRPAALEGAAYVITQLRVGQMAARQADEYLGRRHGLVGQETTGVGGMAKALRTIPVLLEITAEMRRLAPGALLVNFTNPAGLVTQALADCAPDIPSVGVCNVAYNTKMTILNGMAERLGRELDPARAELNTLGLNHLTWHRGFTLDGEEMWPQVMAAAIESAEQDPHPEWEPATLRALNMLPNYYLQYYYNTAHKLEEQQAWPPSRGETVAVVEGELLAQYADPALSEPPADLMKRGGAYYSTVATQLLNAHWNDLGETHVCNVAQRGAVAGWPKSWVLEMPCRVGRPSAASPSGITPLPAVALPDVCFGLLAQIKSFEMLTVQAAVYGDRTAAYQALLAHPLGPSAGQVQAVLDDLLETNRPYLPRFWGD